MNRIRNILFPLAILAAVVLSIASCSSGDDSTWNEYAAWRELNEDWLAEMAMKKLPDGSPEYTRVVPSWNENAYVLMKWFNDTALTAGNLRPVYTSTVDVKYKGMRYNDEPFDSSYVNVQYGDSIFRSRLDRVIEGWAIAMERMHVGDSVEVLIPYQQAYGAQIIGTKGTPNYLEPYSALKFGIKLVDVAGEYIRP